MAYGVGGGGILNGGGAVGSSPTLTNCTFHSNVTFDRGGGIYHSKGDVTLTNCLFIGNEAEDSGGGLRVFDYSSPTVINCTFVGNSAYAGGAIANWPYCSPTIVNCILWGNEAVKGDEVINDVNSHPEFSYCDIAGGWNGPKVFNQAGSTVINGGGNINTDPLFMDATNPDIYARDYRLSAESPCIDAGTDAGVYTDIEGNPRPVDFPDVDNNGDLPEFDIGAYEAVLPYGMAVASIEAAIAEKTAALEKIEAALDKEIAAQQFLDELLAGDELGNLTKADILKAKAGIRIAVLREQRCRAGLAKSIRRLEDALDALGYEVEPSVLPDDGQQGRITAGPVGTTNGAGRAQGRRRHRPE